MSKKILYRVMAIILVLATVLGTTGAAFAAPAGDPEARVRVGGEIVSVSDPDFVLRAPDGREISVHTTGATQWHNLDGFASLQAGMRVGVAGILTGNGTINATHVAVRPAFRLAGVVTGTGDHSLTVHTRNGRDITLLWDENTRCAIFGRGDGAESNSACGRIQTGDHLAAGGTRDGDTLLANWIVARVPRTDDVPGLGK